VLPKTRRQILQRGVRHPARAEIADRQLEMHRGQVLDAAMQVHLVEEDAQSHLHAFVRASVPKYPQQ
jgi:hypothetical protein